MISDIFQTVTQDNVEHSTVTGIGTVLVALNVAIMATSALSVGLVCVKIWGMLSIAALGVPSEVGPLNQTDDMLCNRGLAENPSTLSQTAKSDFRTRPNSPFGIKAKGQHPRKVPLRRPRYSNAATVPTHAINISINSSADPAGKVVSVVERVPASCEPLSSERKSPPNEPDQHVANRKASPASNEGQAAAIFKTSSALNSLGFERVIENRDVRSDSGYVPQKKVSSIGQQLVEMNRKVRLGD